ncbi:glycosyltransferase family 10 domain-containing protein [Butyrivibrio sp. INlla14]|uniref:glycosyltransferase family 10 domain-containing protein n=1 Tax=Butyrivibrio sp. INlla14 TaxID=1520808 RepID=UPI000876EEA8|nr:glycosyltransferase family 10 [Butyrivibrio sp. INlla14]SCY73215.1 Glycosyltransferase family 10 (fucosyltransferase) C-term [Butyrivibrio sp. INlla14]
MVNICFVDWWDGFDQNENFITKILDKHLEYKLVTDPKETDFVFCSVFGKEFLNYSCPRILFTGENYVPDFNFYDYAIGFDYIDFGDRYIRYPLYLACYGDACAKLETGNIPYVDIKNKGFCSFVVSNHEYAESYREKLFDALSSYKFVASGGKHRNNIELPNGVEDKMEFARHYKFAIACENASHPGYCTEKIVEAFAADTVPIYWGDPYVDKYFNPKAFVNCNEFSNIDDVVDYVKKIDMNDDLYLDMLKQPKVVEGNFSFNSMREDFSNWLIAVVSQNMDNAYRRNRTGFVNTLEKDSFILKEYKEKREKKQESIAKRRKIRLFRGNGG